jgi:PAS domain S-box-containing protein
MGASDGNESSLLRDLTALQNPRSIASFLEVTFDAVVVFDPQERITSWNPAAEKMFGWTVQEALGKTPAELFWPVDIPLKNEYKNQRQTRLSRGETLQGEITPCRKDGSSFPAQFTARAIFDPDGKVSGYLSVYRDISDKVQAQEKERQLQQSNQRLNQILGSIQDDFYVLNRDWVFIFASRTFTSRIGKEPEDFVGNKIWEMFPHHVGGTLYENFHVAMEKREVRRFEIPGRYTNAWYRMTAFPSEEGITVLGTDISERRRTEDMLRQQAQLLDLSSEAIFVWQLHGAIEYWNKGAEKLYGYSSAEAIGQVSHELLATQHPQGVMAFIATVERDGGWRGELAHHTRDGHVVTVESNQQLIQQGEQRLVLETNRDITERKKAEAAVQMALTAASQSEQRLQRVLETDAVGVLFFDQGGSVIQANDVFLNMTGYTREQIERCELSWRKMTPPEWVEISEAQMERFAQTGRIGPYEKEYFLADGSRRWMLFAGRAVGDGTIAEYCIDISDRKRAEAALEQSRKTFQELIERAPFGVYVIDSQFRIAHMNASSQTGAFRNVRPVIGRDFSEAIHILWPEETASGVISAFRHTLKTGESYYSPRFTNPRQDVAEVESYEWELQRMTLPDGQYGVICYYYDSTKLRNAETAARESEERFSKAFHASPVGINIFRLPEARAIDVNEAFLDLTGYSRDEFIGHTGSELNVFVNRNQPAEMLKKLQEQGIVRNLEVQIRHKSGNLLSTLFSIVQIELNGEACGLVLVVDITARKQAENALRTSQAMLQSFYDSAPFMMGIVEVDGNSSVLVSGNQAVADFYTSQLAGMIGHKSHELGTPIEVEHMWVEKYRQSQTQGAPVRFEHEYPQTGSGNWFQSTVSFIELGPSGKPRFSFVTENITGRKQAETALLENEKELQQLNESLEQKVQEKTAEVRSLAADLVLAVQRERHRISHILHDDLQQRIYAIQMQLTFLRNELYRVNQAAYNETLDIGKQMENVLEITRHLSVDLSPPILQDEGLAQAISWLANQMRQRYGLTIELQADGSFMIPNEELQVLLFNCVRELLFNVVKHAEANRAVVALQWPEDILKIEVSDNGKGFPTQIVAQQLAAETGEEEDRQLTFGLPTLRHQLSLFGGQLEIRSNPGKGTAITIIVPVAKTA